MPATDTPSNRFVALMPLFGSMTSLVVGSSYAKTLFPLVGPAGTVTLRTGLAALLLVAVCRPWQWRLNAAQWHAAAIYGAVLAGMNLAFYEAIARLPIGIAIAIEFLGPLGLAVAGSRRWLDGVWIALAALGVVLLVKPGSGATGLDPLGIVYALGAAVGWAAYIVAGKHAGRRLTNAQAVSVGLLIAGLITLPIGIATAGMALIEPHALALGGLVALLCSAIPYPLELLALRRLSTTAFGVVMSLEPAAGAVAGLAILGEQLSGARWLAIVAVVIASAGITLARSDAASAPTDN